MMSPMTASLADEKKLQDFLIKIATIVRLLASDKVGEAENAIPKVGQVIKSAGPDMVNLVADRIEKGAELSEEEIKQLYDVALAECERKHAAKAHGTPSGSYNGIAAMPGDQAMMKWCLNHVDDMHEKDREFIRGAYARVMRWGATPRQRPWLEDLYLRTGGPT
jgi:hypothetical protein